jgi:hypothetical protein
MPNIPYANQLEPSQGSVIWRFMDLFKFRDLMASEELYFRRADLFQDESEGLPPEQYAMRVLGLDPYDVRDRIKLNDHLGFLAQNRESYYISCWHLYRLETLDMWSQYGDDGVAICSQYGLLKSALDGFLDETHLGLIRYGTNHLATTFNTIEFITTKQIQYLGERELRAWLIIVDPLASGNRHIGLNNLPNARPLDVNPRNSWVADCKRRRIDLRSLITQVVISPWAERDTIEEVEIWLKSRGLPAPKPSEITSALTPKPERKPAVVKTNLVIDDDLNRFYEELSGLNPSRVRFLYRQRWEACRLSSGRLPSVGDIQYLETTLRVLDDWRRKGIDVWSSE